MIVSTSITTLLCKSPFGIWVISWCSLLIVSVGGIFNFFSVVQPFSALSLYRSASVLGEWVSCLCFLFLFLCCAILFSPSLLSSKICSACGVPHTSLLGHPIFLTPNLGLFLANYWQQYHSYLCSHMYLFIAWDNAILLHRQYIRPWPKFGITQIGVILPLLSRSSDSL